MAGISGPSEANCEIFSQLNCTVPGRGKTKRSGEKRRWKEMGAYQELFRTPFTPIDVWEDLIEFLDGHFLDYLLCLSREEGGRSWRPMEIEAARQRSELSPAFVCQRTGRRRDGPQRNCREDGRVERTRADCRLQIADCEGGRLKGCSAEIKTILDYSCAGPSSGKRAEGGT